jgi:hypothetical protein
MNRLINEGVTYKGKKEEKPKRMTRKHRLFALHVIKRGGYILQNVIPNHWF